MFCVDWINKYFNRDIPLGERLIAFAIIEGVFFASSFASIFWLKTKGNLMPAIIMANNLIQVDESIHISIAVNLYNNYIKDLKSTKRKNIFIEVSHYNKNNHIKNGINRSIFQISKNLNYENKFNIFFFYFRFESFSIFQNFQKI